MLIILRLNIPNRHSGAAAVRLAARLRASPILRGRRRVPFADASSLAGERARSFARSSLEAIMLYPTFINFIFVVLNADQKYGKMAKIGQKSF